ncbi:O-methyltransferase MdmC [Acrasis kona]|uniref:O-methyltransferase MdmC n=1 Tax=Acrasis kona TaxID=1008807 RepID=A0AAW2YUC5_9EUKA
MNKGSRFIQQDIVEYGRLVTVRENEAQKQLREETIKLMGGRAMMISSPEQQQLTKVILKLLGARKCLEVGTFTGYSALCTALAIPDDGKVVCCDISEEWTSVGKKYWKDSGVQHKIDLRIAPAEETLDELIKSEPGSFDFAFIDADKTGYDSYYEKCLKLVRRGGLISIDNVLRGGRVLDPSNASEDDVAIRELNNKIMNDNRVEPAMVTISDGVTFVYLK